MNDLRLRGHKTLCATSSKILGDAMRAKAVPVIAPPNTGQAWARLLSSQGISHVVGALGALPALFSAAKKLGIRTTLLCQQVAENVLFREARNLACVFSDWIVAPSRFVMEDIASDFDLAKLCIPNGIELSHPVTESEVVSLRTSLGFSKKDLIVGCVARLHPQKRLTDLARVVRYLNEQGVVTRLLLVTRGEEKKASLEWEEILSELNGYACRAVAVCLRSDSQALIRCMDVFVAPFEREALSLALLEAAASNVPLVVARSGGLVEVLEKLEGKSAGFGDIADIAEKVISVRGTSPDNRSRIQQYFSVSSMSQQYRELWGVS